MGKPLTRMPTVGSLRPALSEYRREMGLLAVLLVSLFALVSLLGYSPQDPTPLNLVEGEVRNPCGHYGAFAADILFSALGVGAYVTGLVAVHAVAGILGRVMIDSVRAVGLVGLLATTLPMVHLVYGRGDAYDPGGMVGGALADLLVDGVGHVGAWLILPTGALLMATALFQIPWGHISSKTLSYGESLLAWLKRRALPNVSNAGAEVVARVTDSVGRMGTSLTRRDDDTAPWTVPSELEALPDSPAGYTPASYVEVTEVNAPDAVGEVRYVPTSDYSQVRRTPEVQAQFGAFVPRERAQGNQDPANMGLYREPATAPNLPAKPVVDFGTPRRTPRTGTPPPSVPPLPPMLPESEDPTPLSAIPREARPSLPPLVRSSLPQVQVPSAAVPTPPTDRVQPAAFLGQWVEDDGGVVGSFVGPEYELPSLSLLDPVREQDANYDAARLEQLAAQVEDTLGSFKVRGTVTDVRVGPVVTTFEFLPAKGISVRKIANLQDDLAMGLKAKSVRIVAPIPGKGVVGIEIPSENRLVVYLREMLASAEFREHGGALPVVLGKDVEGAPVVDDLAKMPHLLVGGTTGSGKSVGVNGMLLSLLFRMTPDKLRLLLVDPKKLEFKMYEDIPHLIHPVVTEPKQAAAALAWACREMDDRYERLAQWDCRNIAAYNRKVERESRSWTREKARQYAPSDWTEGDPLPEPERLPYIVVVIDELADLMLVARKEVEGSIARLTQMARACGIHLVVATQRPSVDVVTGLIKSNLPTRISFKLRSGTDSRTILDTTGADALLGRGDMLYLPNAGDIQRVHGPFASDEETLRVLDFLRRQGEPEYVDGVVDGGGDNDDGAFDEDLDVLYDDAVELCVKAGKASTSMIQRHFRIGYNRAARIVDQMERRGVVGPADGARPREVLGSGTRP